MARDLKKAETQLMTIRRLAEQRQAKLMTVLCLHLSSGWLSTVTIGSLKNANIHLLQPVMKSLLLGKQVTMHIGHT
jgi:hypothetical protein